MAQEVYFGWGSIDRIYDVLEKQATCGIFLVSGKESYVKTGAEKKLHTLDKKYEVVRFFDFATNTKSEDVKKGCALFSSGRFDAIISVGGGSVLDMAKLVKASVDIGIDEVIDGRLDKITDVLHIAIPTTAGTGSEATHFAVVYRNKKKHSVAHPSLLPNIAIVDPELTMSMSPHLTATTGLDALAQAIESYWSVNATKESREYSRKALELIVPNLERAIRKPSRDAREGMAFGAYYAGAAIDIAKTTAPHALSYFFTSYFGVPHGHAVALTLAACMRYNMDVTESDVADPRGVAAVRECIDEILSLMYCADVEVAMRYIGKVMTAACLQQKLSDFGVTENDIEACVQSVNIERLKNNPRMLSQEAIRTMLISIL